jgi:hypothetical protein
MKNTIPFLVMILLLTISTRFVIRNTGKFVQAIGFQIDTVYNHISSVDHTKFEILQQEFSEGPEVTNACLSCHNGRVRGVNMFCSDTENSNNLKLKCSCNATRALK